MEETRTNGSERQHQSHSTGLVRLWLSVVAALVVAMILVGGATRLTDSGLSITEWQLITGFIPPLSKADWADVFAKYQLIPEYQLVNKGMSLSEFKVIFWWEWGHRFLGRIVGFVVLIPLVLFWWRGVLAPWLKRRLVVIFLLGAAQGALGWYMVMSGLVERVDVSQYRLAAHLGLAVVIVALVFWTILDLRQPSKTPPVLPGRSSGFFRSATLLAALIFVQILAGALVAGIDAGQGYNTWPLMDGALVPSGLLATSPWYLNVFENALTVQFDHRILAYLIALFVLVQAAKILSKPVVAAKQSAVVLVVVMGAQLALGIWALLAHVPLDLSLAHQGGAIVLLLVALWHAHAIGRAEPDGQPVAAAL